MILDRPSEPGKKKAMLFTLAVHLLLIAALFLGVQWKRSEPEAMQVELWSPTPVKATRVAPPPEPPKEVVPEPKKPAPVPVKVEVPKKPDIVVKEEKKKPPEPKKPEPAKPKPKVDPFKEMLERESRERQAVAEQNLMAALAEKEQRAAANRRGLESYAAKIRSKIRGNIVLPPGIKDNPEAIFMVNQLPGGEILDIRLKRSSGLPALDEAIDRAIRKSSPLPPPADPALFQRVLEIKYKPFEE